MIPTIIPIRIEILWLSITGLSHPATDFVKAYAKSRWTGIRETTSSIVALNKDGSEIWMAIDGFKTTVVSTRNATTQLQAVENKLCYNIDWKPDVDLLSKEQAQIYCEQGSQAMEEPAQFYKEMDFLLMIFITRAIDPILSREPESLKPHVRKYLDWMVQQRELFDISLPPFSSSNWNGHKTTDAVYITELCNRIESSCAQGKFFVTVGRNLLAILSGELDPLDLLFRGDLVKGHYAEVVRITPLISFPFTSSQQGL